MQKHTPEVIGDPKDPMVGVVVIEPPCGCRILLGKGTLQQPVEIGYCRLHAAAPKLLEALFVVLDAVDYAAHNCRSTEMVGAVLPMVLIVKARAAIAKATEGATT